MARALDSSEPRGFLVAIPAIIGIVAILVASQNKSPRIYGYPALLVILYLGYQLVDGSKSSGMSLSDMKDIGNMFSGVFGIGLHMTWVSTLVLAVVGLANRAPLNPSDQAIPLSQDRT